ncbi:hypothetical protein RRG08_028404 [Elysia crispata]|uniref:Uncharacterized protein n=1 Tax=Elysia crispata TaxID=231223 RepID=A0AAE0Y340_9GAST|nr:hypothetical protein RRG08_028404 [Elysia crispata]
MHKVIFKYKTNPSLSLDHHVMTKPIHPILSLLTGPQAPLSSSDALVRELKAKNNVTPFVSIADVFAILGKRRSADFCVWPTRLSVLPHLYLDLTNLADGTASSELALDIRPGDTIKSTLITSHGISGHTDGKKRKIWGGMHETSTQMSKLVIFQAKEIGFDLDTH